MSNAANLLYGARKEQTTESKASRNSGVELNQNMPADWVPYLYIWLEFQPSEKEYNNRRLLPQLPFSSYFGPTDMQKFVDATYLHSKNRLSIAVPIDHYGKVKGKAISLFVTNKTRLGAVAVLPDDPKVRELWQKMQQNKAEGKPLYGASAVLFTNGPSSDGKNLDSVDERVLEEIALVEDPAHALEGSFVGGASTDLEQFMEDWERWAAENVTYMANMDKQSLEQYRQRAERYKSVVDNLDMRHYTKKRPRSKAFYAAYDSSTEIKEAEIDTRSAFSTLLLLASPYVPRAYLDPTHRAAQNAVTNVLELCGYENKTTGLDTPWINSGQETKSTTSAPSLPHSTNQAVLLNTLLSLTMAQQQQPQASFDPLAQLSRLLASNSTNQNSGATAVNPLSVMQSLLQNAQLQQQPQLSNMSPAPSHQPQQLQQPASVPSAPAPNDPMAMLLAMHNAQAQPQLPPNLFQQQQQQPQQPQQQQPQQPQQQPQQQQQQQLTQSLMQALLNQILSNSKTGSAATAESAPAQPSTPAQRLVEAEKTKNEPVEKKLEGATNPIMDEARINKLISDQLARLTQQASASASQASSSSDNMTGVTDADTPTAHRLKRSAPDAVLPRPAMSQQDSDAKFDRTIRDYLHKNSSDSATYGNLSDAFERTKFPSSFKQILAEAISSNNPATSEFVKQILIPASSDTYSNNSTNSNSTGSVAPSQTAALAPAVAPPPATQQSPALSQGAPSLGSASPALTQMASGMAASEMAASAPALGMAPGALNLQAVSNSTGTTVVPSQPMLEQQLREMASRLLSTNPQLSGSAPPATVAQPPQVLTPAPPAVGGVQLNEQVANQWNAFMQMAQTNPDTFSKILQFIGTPSNASLAASPAQAAAGSPAQVQGAPVASTPASAAPVSASGQGSLSLNSASNRGGMVIQSGSGDTIPIKTIFDNRPNPPSEVMRSLEGVVGLAFAPPPPSKLAFNSASARSGFFQQNPDANRYGSNAGMLADALHRSNLSAGVTVLPVIMRNTIDLIKNNDRTLNRPVEQVPQLSCLDDDELNQINYLGVGRDRSLAVGPTESLDKIRGVIIREAEKIADEFHEKSVSDRVKFEKMMAKQLERSVANGGF